jgi:hypothetical protein
MCEIAMQSHVLRDCGSYLVEATLHRFEKVARQLVRRVFREDRFVGFDAGLSSPTIRTPSSISN